MNRPTNKFVKEKITSLEVGQAAAFWLRPHNAMLHIERSAADSARLSACRVQLPSDEVMGMRPPKQCVPAVATDVGWNRIANFAFCKLVAELAEVELEESKTRGRYEPNALSCLGCPVSSELLTFFDAASQSVSNIEPLM